MHDEQQVGIVDAADRREIAHEVVRLLRNERLVHGVSVGHHEKRVAVGARLRHRVRPDHGAGTRAVFDDERLAERFGKPGADEPSVEVGRTAHGERHHYVNRSRRIGLRPRRHANEEQKGSEDHASLSRRHLASYLE
jgi:hypothetical protein